MAGTFLVVGSVNMDVCVAVERFPDPGETVRASSYETAFGGKGANQAVALSRLCAQSRKSVCIAGKIGTDAMGADYRAHLQECGIDTSLLTDSPARTGTAIIEIDCDGNNRIVIVAGANGDISPEWWDTLDLSFNRADRISARGTAPLAATPHGTTPPAAPENLSLTGVTALFQLELPLPATERALRCAAKAGAFVILDPAPAANLSDDIWNSIDIVTPNETEAALYTGIKVTDDTSANQAARWFHERGAKIAILTVGASGAWALSKNEGWFCPAFPVTAVDTTAAGDSFNAGLAYAIDGGMNLEAALRFACAVGALSTTRAGAQGAMPTLSSVEELLRAYPKICPRRA